MKKFYKESIQKNLQNMGCNAAQRPYKGKDTPYIVYYSYSTRTVIYADNKPVAETCYCTVEVYFDDDDGGLVEKAKKRLTKAGWRITDEFEDYNEAKSLNMYVIDISYTGSVR